MVKHKIHNLTHRSLIGIALHKTAAKSTTPLGSNELKIPVESYKNLLA